MRKATGNIHVRVTEELKEKVLAKADKNSQNLSELIRKYFEEYVKENK